MNKLKPLATGLTVAVSLSSLAVFAVAPAYAASNNDSTSKINRYRSDLTPLNDSGVYGNAKLSLQGTKLQVKINASGLVPNQPHVAHIHGSLTGADAQCPTIADDTNNDGFLSVFEGAPKYGPIKLNLTTPQTAFGPNSNATLFAPFAGTPDLTKFPQVGDNGKFKLNQMYSFNLSNSADKQAYDSLKQLDKQHIVIHGDYAPQNVDTAGGGSQEVYDPLLPVACGEIRVVGNGNGSENVEMKMSPVKQDNSTHNQTTTSTTNTTNTNVSATNNNAQSATTGSATVSGKDSNSSNAGSASSQSGNASNNGMATFNIDLGAHHDQQ